MPTPVSKKIDSFFSGYPIKRYKKGKLLILSDAEPKYIFQLIKGYVRQYDISPKGDEVVVNVFKPPAFLPMSWAINKTPNRYFFEAGTDVAVRLAPPDHVVKFIKSEPDVTFNLLSRLYVGTEGLQRRMAHLMGGGAKSRVIFELITEARRFGQPRRDGSYLLDMSESEIGARAGLSRETVSREIKKIKKSQLITYDRQGIVLKDINELERRLGSEI